jgi:predicted MPP superfamily phosphohydrolase
MNWRLNRTVLAVSVILALVYAYVAWRLASGPIATVALAFPFVMIWIVPVLYWAGDRENRSPIDEGVHILSYLCMGWLSFLVVLCVARDGLLLITTMLPLFAGLHDRVFESGPEWVLVGSMLALAGGAAAALRGPVVRRIDIPIDGLDPDLEGLRIVQISDLHVGLAIRGRYVRRVVRMANALDGHILALTGDFVDGPVARLAPYLASLADLKPAGRIFFVPGNHEYYSGANPWMAHFQKLGLNVLLNRSVTLAVGGARLVVGGVGDPAARYYDPGQLPRPELAVAPEAGRALRVLLAHNPKLAPLAEQAGFDLQLSGHTHAGQFFPWTLAVRLVHAPHVAGLSRRGRTWIYVSAGTGSWGPPVRFGTQPELTLLRLVRAG